MELLEIILLAIVQGLTEFLPISSSGHLVLFQDIFNISFEGITVEVFLHTGTLLSVIVIFRKDIIKLFKAFFYNLGIIRGEKTGYERLIWFIIIANIPVGIVGVLFKDKISEYFFADSFKVYIFLIITGMYLFLEKMKFFKKAKQSPADDIKLKDISLFRTIIIGLSQMIAILPGISRSGTTIITGILLKIKREDAAKFSFFIMLPAVGGATLLELLKLDAKFNYFNMAVGFLISFIVGCIALKILLSIVKNYKLHWFGYYCILVGIIGLLLR